MHLQTFALVWFKTLFSIFSTRFPAGFQLFLHIFKVKHDYKVEKDQNSNYFPNGSIPKLINSQTVQSRFFKFSLFFFKVKRIFALFCYSLIIDAVHIFWKRFLAVFNFSFIFSKVNMYLHTFALVWFETLFTSFENVFSRFFSFPSYFQSLTCIYTLLL